MARVRIDIDDAPLRAWLQPGGRAFIHLHRVGRSSTRAARLLCPIDRGGLHPGRLRSSINYEVFTLGLRGRCRVRARARYALYVHEGRGPVVPRRAPILAWRRQDGWHFARRVGPARGQPFLRRGVELTVGKPVRGR